MFHKYNSFTNSLSPTDQISAYVPQSLGTKEATNNFYVAPQPKGRQPGGSGPESKGSLAGRQMTLFRFFTGKSSSGSSILADKEQAVASTLSHGAATVTSIASNAAQAVTSTHAASSTSHGAVSSSHGTSSAGHGAVSSSHGASSTAHGHGSHAAPWEGVNLWRTPYKGDTDTITQVKRNKGTLDKYVENRTRRIQQLQLFALRNKAIPTWVMMPRDKIIFVAQGAIVAYVLYQVTTSVYAHLKAKDRLKLLKLLYKDNVD